MDIKPGDRIKNCKENYKQTSFKYRSTILKNDKHTSKNDVRRENKKMKVTELKINDLEKIVGGVEPPKYLSPEAEAKAKEYAKKKMERIHTNDYIESSSNSGLYRRRNVLDDFQKA